MWCELHLKNQEILFAFETFFEETERFLILSNLFFDEKY